MEIWKKIKNYSNYEVSSLGRVRSIDRKSNWAHHGLSGKSKLKGKVLKGVPRKKSKNLTYIQYGLSKKNKIKVYYAHRLVAQAFIPNPLNKKQVNHIDGDGTNNKVNNLEWVTASENGLHAYKFLGRTVWHKGMVGKRTPTAKAVLQKDLNNNLIKQWDCASDAVRKFGFDSGSITKTCQGKQKSHHGYKWEYA